MDKTDFLNVIQHYASTSVDEAQTIRSLRAQYPYSQLLQTLTARSSKDHGFPNQQRDLQLAAVYSADRALLKEIITLDPEDPVQQVVSKHVHANDQVVSTIDSVDVADIVMDDLEQLSKLKGAFENLFMDHPKAEKIIKNSDSELPPPEEIPTGETETGEESMLPNQETAARSKKARIIDVARAMNSASPSDGTTPPKKKTPRQKRQPGRRTD